jgi:hypothetical protein
MGVTDFFSGFASHAHTMNEIGLDQVKEEELRRANSPEEAHRLTGMVMDKLENDISKSGHGLDDVKLLVMYLSYRGESKEKDSIISESVLGSIRERFDKRSASSELRLIGHTTAGELENEDLVLKEISGVGHNGLSVLALVTNLPIGVGRTWGLRTPKEAGEQGKEMARDAWVDFSQQTTSKEQLQVRKTLLVLTQGGRVQLPGYEHFLAEGVANFMGSNREARIMNVIGGSSGDGLNATLFHQFYGKLKEQPRFKILDGEAVCALIPNLCEVSLGLAVDGLTRVGRQQTFHFNAGKEPYFKYVSRIGKEDSCIKYADMIYENEVRLSKEKGVPLIDEKVILQAVADGRAPNDQSIAGRTLVFNPILGKYAFVFPFGNYAGNVPIRAVGDDIELIFPIRNYTPEMPGYLAIGDHEKVQKGAHRLYDMLRADQGFGKNDATLLVCCINRKLVEMMAGCRSGTEAEILKEGLSSTQAIGFLSYGELSFTHLIQEPYFYSFSCWGMTFHSKTAAAESKEKKTEIGIKDWIKGKT